MIQVLDGLIHDFFTASYLLTFGATAQGGMPKPPS